MVQMKDAKTAAGGNPRYAALVREILKIIRSENWEAGQRITEQAMAKRLGVSRSPVRAALEVLRSRELVTHQSNKGYLLAVSWDSRQVSDGNFHDDPSSRLYRTIMSERFASLLGERVSVSGLAKRYKKPRTMVEEVLARMREDGVIERGNGRFWLFRHSLVDETSFLESCHYCLIMEPAALHDPKFRIDHKRIAALRRRYQQLHTGEAHKSMDDLLDINAAFHTMLADFCGNRFLAQAIRQHTLLRRMGGYDAYALRTNMDEEFGEHLDILDLVGAGDLENAARMMHQHLLNTLHRRPDIARARAFAHRRLTRH